MHANIARQSLFALGALCLGLSLSTLPAAAAGTGYNMTYVNGVKTVTLPAETATLTPGPNVALVTQECASCHSVDYPTTQPYQTRTGWEAVMHKMEHDFAMVLTNASDEVLIVDYLTNYYGQ